MPSKVIVFGKPAAVCSAAPALSFAKATAPSQPTTTLKTPAQPGQMIRILQQGDGGFRHLPGIPVTVTAA